MKLPFAIPSFLLGPIGFIRQWLPLITLAIGVAFGLWFHSLLDAKEKLATANEVITDTGKALGQKDKRDTARAIATDKRLESEKVLTTDLEKAIAKSPDNSRPVADDIVRILNGF